MPRTVKIGGDEYEVENDFEGAKFTIGDSVIFLDDLQYLTGLKYETTPSVLDNLEQGLYITVWSTEENVDPKNLVGHDVYTKDEEGFWYVNGAELEVYELDELETDIERGKIYRLVAEK